MKQEEKRVGRNKKIHRDQGEMVVDVDVDVEVEETTPSSSSLSSSSSPAVGLFSTVISLVSWRKTRKI